jgi:hypothetical protein
MRCAHFAIGLGFSIVLSIAIASEVVSVKATAALRTLTKDFVGARSAPLGSRPGPPSIDLASLYGLSGSTIRGALGVPETYEKSVPPSDCHAKLCWSFTYGPAPAPLEGPLKNDGGATSIDVRNGGPWLLIFGLENDQVVEVVWQRQR